MRHHRHHRPNPASGQRGGLSTGTLLLLGGAAFVLLTPQGRALISGLGLGTGSSIPSSLPVGTTRLANGQYRLPNGQIVGAPFSGQSAMTGSSIVPIVGAAIQSLPSLYNFFSRLFSSTQGGTGTGGATGSPGAGGSASIPATGGGTAPIDISIGQITLGDGQVLDLGGATGWDLTPLTLGVDTTLLGPDWWGGTPTIEMTNTFNPALDTSGFSFDSGGWAFDPGAFSLGGLGALPAAARVGYTPPPMRHG